MMFYLKTINLKKVLNFLIKIFLFVLPWQTIWIYRESFLNGVKWEYGTLGFYGTEILLWVIIFLFMAWYWKKFKLQVISYKLQITKDRVFVLAVLSFIIYHLLSIIWSPDKSLALQQSLRVLEATLLFFVLFLGPLRLSGVVKWFAAGAILPCLLGIWQFLMQSTFASTLLGLSSHPVWEAGTSIIQSDSIGRWLRAYGPFSHPNVFGGYLVISIILLLIFYLRKVESGKWKVLFLIPYSLFLIALFFTFSRSAWLAFAVVLFSYCYIAYRHLSPRIAIYFLSFILLLVGIFSIIYFPLVQTRLSSQSISEIRSTEERVSGYHDAWQLFKLHPWLGVGAGNYTLTLYQLNPDRPGWEYQPMHNALALFVVEQGVVGLVLILLIFVSFVNLMIKEKEVRNKYFFIPYSLFFIPLLFFDHYFYSSFIGLMLGAVFFGLVNKCQLTK